MTRYALILNNDTEGRHLSNVDLALRQLKSEGYQTFVASPKEPHEKTDVFVAPENYKDLIARLKAKSTEKDEIVIYTTGHGTLLEEKEAGIILGDTFVKGSDLANLLTQIKCQRRLVLMDQCYSGSWQNFFADKKPTLFYSPGGTLETGCCAQSAPRLWEASAKIIAGDGDSNHDGKISLYERALFSFGGVKFSTPLLFTTGGYELDADPGIPRGVVEVKTEEELDAALAKIKGKAGRYAVVFFGATWCGACKKFTPDFEAQAKASRGQHVFIMTTNEDLSKKYSIRSIPEIIAFRDKGDGRYEPQVIGDRKHILETLESPGFERDFSLAEKIKDIREGLESGDSHKIFTNLQRLESILNALGTAEIRETLDMLIPLLRNPTTVVPASDAFLKILSLGKIDRESAQALRKKLYLQALEEDPGSTFVKLAPILSEIPNFGLEAAEAKQWIDLWHKVLLASPQESAGLISTYHDLLPRLTTQDLRTEFEWIKSLINNSKPENAPLAFDLLYNYFDVQKKIDGPTVLPWLDKLRNALSRANGSAGKNLLKVYGQFVSALDPAMKAAEFQKIRTLLESTPPDDKNVRPAILAATGIFEPTFATLAEQDQKSWLDLIRRDFGHSDGNTRSAAVQCYSIFVRENNISRDMMSSELDTLRQLFSNPNADVRATAIEAYKKIAGSLFFGQYEEIPKLLNLCDTRGLGAKSALNVLEQITPNCCGLSADLVAQKMRRLMGNPRTQTTTIDIYKKVIPDITNITTELESLRSLLTDPKLGPKVLELYQDLARRLTPGEMKDELASIRSLRQDKTLTSVAQETLVRAISSFASRLPPSEIRDEMNEVIKFFTSPRCGFVMAEIYAKYVLQLGEKDISSALEGLKPLLTVPESMVAAAQAYKILCEHLDEKEFGDELKSLRRLWSKKDATDQSRLAVLYGSLVGIRSNFDVALEARELRKEFLNPQTQVAALYAYKQLLTRFSDKAFIASEIKALARVARQNAAAAEAYEALK